MGPRTPAIPEALFVGEPVNSIENNPFAVTKAVDLSDQQINDYWVDMPGGAGFVQMARPSAPMSMLIIGGKGSGKTHLMRYFSYPLQLLRHNNDGIKALQEERYVGVFLRCGGLNAARFEGKGQSAEVWDSVFAYRMDLLLAQLTLRTLTAVNVPRTQSADWQTNFIKALREQTDVQMPLELSTIASLAELLSSRQQAIDRAVNNAALSRELAVEIGSSPGTLVFGLPRAFVALCPEMDGVTIAFLIDELENLNGQQQRYIQTLIREREAPCTFRIGARRYGVRTYKTYSADEENREGSEYELLVLDDRLRDNKNYHKFARQLIARRLVQAGFFAADEGQLGRVEDRLDSLFEHVSRTSLANEEASFIIAKYRGKERPYFRSLRAKLSAGAPGVETANQIDAIIEELSFPDHPLLEKVAIHLLYGEWARHKNLPAEARSIRTDCESHLAGDEAKTRAGSILSHFKDDLVAQLRRDCETKQYYLGVDSFIAMSKGLPKNLLIILKHIVQWASFNGETPFRSGAITRETERTGVLEAARWFLHDAEVLGKNNGAVSSLIQRLGDLFKEIRFSDRPAECSLTTFSVEKSTLSPNSKAVLLEAEEWSLLVGVGAGQKDRNSGRLDAKYQLNPMLSPLWDLAIARRGAIALSSTEIDALCNVDSAEPFEGIKRERLARMNAPFAAHRRVQHHQSSLLPHE